MAIDNRSVIVALTNGIGAHLGQQARRSFFELESRLKRIPLFARLDGRSQQQVGIDLLAVSMFLQYRDLPVLESSVQICSPLLTKLASHMFGSAEIS